MQRKFLSWLFVLICTAFAVAGGLAFLQFQRQSEARARDLMESRLQDLMLLVRYSQENIRHMEEMNDASIVERTRAVAEILRLNPGILSNQESLQGICNDLGATQICITDEAGIIIAGVPQSVVGFDLSRHVQSQPFMKCISSPGYELIQRPQSNAQGGLHLQYCAVSRLDARGMVQLGFMPQHEQSARSSIDFEKLVSNIMKNTEGHIVAFKDGQLLNRGALNIPTSTLLALPLNHVGEVNIGGHDYATFAIEEEGLRLVSLMPWKDITKISFKSLRYLLLSNIGLFVLMFIVVWVLLRRYVINGLQQINRALCRITEGYTEERVVVRDTPEFTRLSTGINAMVDALQSYGEQKREQLNHELHLASAIQRTVLPSSHPAFPEKKEFDIYALNSQSKNIGGDFYDYFMSDNKHLCFLLGDVATTGIPAALFMMRAITIIREQAKTGATPKNVVTRANKELCADASSMRLSLFYGRLNITTGDLRFVNAGTPQALHRAAGQEYEMLSMNSGAVLGAHAGASYNECRLTLQPGDRLFLYTNGVVSAADAEHTPFGTLRLQEALRAPADSVVDVPAQVRAALQRFTGNTEQHHDISMLSLEYRGKWLSRAEVSTTAAHPESALAALQEKLESVLAAPDDITSLHSTLAAVLATLPAECTVSMQLNCNEQEAQIILTYNMPQFNPLARLPHLPVDKATYTPDKQGCSVLKLRKSLQ
ncbi:MAG: SpoIIE family protein phosphatase [Akkermansia sp.]|nr:SpoIIE family protein phosphatase [Akkermansia sp.]